MAPHNRGTFPWLIALGEGFDRDLDFDTAHVPTHIYIISGVPHVVDGQWLVAEACSKGFVEHYVAPRTGDVLGAVWIDPEMGRRYAVAAGHMATLGIGYDWLAIVRQAIRGFGAIGHVQGLTEWLLEHIIAKNSNPRRAICSEAAAVLLEQVVGRDPRLEPTWKETPLDLWLYCLDVLAQPVPRKTTPGDV